MGQEKRLTVVFDLETSGFAGLPKMSNYHKIVQICATALETGATFTEFVNPGGTIPAPSTAIHKITNEDVRDAPGTAEVLHRMEEFFDMGTYDVVEMIAHNCKNFDEPILRKEYLAVGRPVPPQMVFWDTLIFFRRKYVGLKSFSLGNLYKHFYGKDFSNAHRADADVMALVRLYKDYVATHRDPNGGYPPKPPELEQSLVSLYYVGPTRAYDFWEKTGANTISELQDYWQVSVVADPFSLDNFLRNELGMGDVTERMIIASQILQIPIYDKSLLEYVDVDAPEDCLNEVDYYVKYKHHLKTKAPNRRWYYKGVAAMSCKIKR
jgi:DNA polymerase III epsilon subunit-like protein